MHLKKVLDKLQVAHKEMQSPLLTFNRFHILFLGLLFLGLVFVCWVSNLKDSKNNNENKRR